METQEESLNRPVKKNLVETAQELLDFLKTLLEDGEADAIDLLVNYGPELVAKAEGKETL
ncbi:hypothetical protein LCGC14_2424040 [marine sediment metagenome]|uniref:Uncharacterized protein n=1 Tax=marine sediment metagenome TaxID=412755 RepID=A0A0F9EHZ2_9ZZZZ